MAHPHPHNHTHYHHSSWWDTLLQALHLRGHEHTPMTADPAFNANQAGIRTIWMALGALGLTSFLQITIVSLSGSVALLADTVHNIGDTLNSIPLLIAFYLARRAANRRYTYGYGRAEDVAGVLIVLSIAVSAGVVFWESTQKLLNPQPMQHIPWVALAALIGFIGNEAVAYWQIRVGRKIGSEAMIADGLHARIDGMTSLAVLFAAAGTALGAPILDPLIGLLIGITILFITRDATKRVWYRLMDAVDPALITQIEHYIEQTSGVEAVERVRARWVGHQLYIEAVMTASAPAIIHQVYRTLRQHIPHFGDATLQLGQAHPSEIKPIGVLSILPTRYQLNTPSPAPMGAAGLVFDADGKPAWNDIWMGFCELALAGGPPHRGTLLEPVSPSAAQSNPIAYQRVLDELERGIRMVTGLEVVQSPTPGWIGMVCHGEEMAVWLLRAIVVENVSVRREASILYFPAGPDFRLEREIKNIITVIAKTHHYWQDHIAPKTNPI